MTSPGFLYASQGFSGGVKAYRIPSSVGSHLDRSAQQARYRQKQLNEAKKLEITVQKLRADIPVLDLQRNRLLYGGQQTVWNVVVEYFHVFRFGIPVTLSVESIDSTDMTVDCLENAEAKHQLAFLRFDGGGCDFGRAQWVDALMDQWRWYSSSFQSLYFQLKRIERVSDHFVVRLP
ncbi:bZIP transcription factor 1 [Phytophthora cinnamomi]|uniref:bZIP transcription factor 1 n=1 Tax=Phytophthora cinnamomi TaxID=4785 RepID=UPI0035594BCE|nr:bZIP transcription factor 1 [Phytophthora cinnamomi]